jgi:hypothetical protein
MTTNKIITTLGIFILFSYGIIRILDFYGVSVSSYGSYLAFYSFLIISIFVLPNDYYKIKSNINNT